MATNVTTLQSGYSIDVVRVEGKMVGRYGQTRLQETATTAGAAAAIATTAVDQAHRTDGRSMSAVGKKGLVYHSITRITRVMKLKGMELMGCCERRTEPGSRLAHNSRSDTDTR